MAKPKQLIRPPKKQKPKAAVPETADEFQEAADREEEAGGKWRAGDPTKSGRAFVRALEIYDKALRKHPSNFDLAYNKARLELEITQQPALVEHIGLPLVDLLRQTLESHRYALRLNQEDQALLFNTSQVLTSLAEQFTESGRSPEAIELLQEALELLSTCLSRQEMLLEQQRLDFDDVEEGGVQLEPGEQAASPNGSELSEQSALIETPISASDLLDTVHASLSALTTLVPQVEQPALQAYGDMAHALTEKKALNYISLLPTDAQDQARFALGLDRAIFIAALADEQYSSYVIELDDYLQRLDSFHIPGRENNAHALSAEGEARTELVLSTFDRFEGSDNIPADTCWKQLTVAQDLYTKATKLNAEDARERKGKIYESRGNAELLRHRLATQTDSTLSEKVKQSARTLIQNAQTYYKGSAQLANAVADVELAAKAQQRWLIASTIGAVLYGLDTKDPGFDPRSARGDLVGELEECAELGLIDMSLEEEVMRRLRQ